MCIISLCKYPMPSCTSLSQQGVAGSGAGGVGLIPIQSDKQLWGKHCWGYRGHISSFMGLEQKVGSP
ncbi:hypothetical protein XENTR_v10015204 [Xenopus tropicalis]|nr:hypothetical protein XENTR_v10015204 [Xenopus tropicalis]